MFPPNVFLYIRFCGILFQLLWQLSAPLFSLSHVGAYLQVETDQWPGGKIVMLESALTRPTASDCAANYIYIRPVLVHSPDRATCHQFPRVVWRGCFIDMMVSLNQIDDII